MFTGADLVLSPMYYPLIDSNKDISVNDTLSLFGQDDFLLKKIVSSEKNFKLNSNRKLMSLKSLG